MTAPAEDPRLTAGRAVVARVLGEEVAALTADLRGELEALLRPNEKVTAELPGGQVIGDVARSKVSTRGVVTDPAAVLDWVQQHRPEEVVLSVNPAFVRHLCDAAKKHGAAVLADGTIVPGVEALPGTAAYRPTVSEDGRQAVLSRLAGLLDDLAAPRLPAPPRAVGEEP